MTMLMPAMAVAVVVYHFHKASGIKKPPKGGFFLC